MNPVLCLFYFTYRSYPVCRKTDKKSSMENDRNERNSLYSAVVKKNAARIIILHDAIFFLKSAYINTLCRVYVYLYRLMYECLSVLVFPQRLRESELILLLSAVIGWSCQEDTVRN